MSPPRALEARRRVRARYGIAADAVLFGVFGGLTPEKRVPQILSAFRALLPHAPSARLLLAGAPAAHYDVAADVAAHGLQDRVALTGYLDTDEEVTDHLAACDVALNLRWPTARETSGPWLRALAAGKATVITDLVHLGDVPSLDPRTWTVNEARWATWEAGGGRREAQAAGQDERQAPKLASRLAPPTSAKATAGTRASPPVCVAIDLLDEDHSLRLAMRRLASDSALREQLGRAAREWWTREHSLDAMADDYERVMREAASRPDPVVDLPAHMRNPGDRTLRALLDPFAVPNPLR